MTGKGPIEEKAGNNKMRYPLTGKKRYLPKDQKSILARAGYLCLDKASFFIDDPNSHLEEIDPAPIYVNKKVVNERPNYPKGGKRLNMKKPFLFIIMALVLSIGSRGQGEHGNTAMNAKTNSIGMKFVYIPPGTFMMGSPPDEKYRDNDERQHRVTLTKGFYLQTTEVTQRQWKTVMGNNPSQFTGDNLPVESISWEDCQEFIRRLNQKEGMDKYRLPTEAEWEYACRAGSRSTFSFGDDPAQLGEYAWFGLTSKRTTHPVGQKKPNAWGLYDMHGNVWEWCQDWYGEYSSGDVVDPEGPPTDTYRVNRGGCWFVLTSYCRSANRYYYSPRSTSRHLGFRVALRAGGPE